MKMYILSDRMDTIAGMRLAGIEGSLIKSEEEFLKYISSNDLQDIAILMVTKSLANMCRGLLDEMKKKNQPLVVEIPDRENCSEENDSITRYVREAMGIKI